MVETKNDPMVILRYKVATDYPYFSSLIFGLLVREVPDDSELQTFAVDKWLRLYYNKTMFTRCSPEELKAVLIHELEHVLREHHERGEHMDPKQFNLAGDMEINDDLEANFKVKLPEWCVFPKTYNLPDNKLAEWYYNNMPKGGGQGNGKCKGNCQKSAKGKQGKGQGQCNCPKDGEGKSDPTGGSCGSISGGSWSEGEPTDKNPGQSKVMKDFFKRDVAEKIVEASKNRGDVPAGLLRWAEEHLKNKIDWKKEFRSFIMKSINETISGMTDYTYQRVSRRQAAFKNIIIPGFQQPIINVAVIQDTSGSMSDSYISQSVAELNNILKVTRANVTFVSVDAEVGFIGRVTSTKKLPIVGGGGTDMCVGYKALEEQKHKPNLVICITDGYTPWPKQPIQGTANCIVVMYQGQKPTVDIPSWAKPLFVDVAE